MALGLQSLGKADSLWLSFSRPVLDLLCGRGLMGVQVPCMHKGGQRQPVAIGLSLPGRQPWWQAVLAAEPLC